MHSPLASIVSMWVDSFLKGEKRIGVSNHLYHRHHHGPPLLPVHCYPTSTQSLLSLPCPHLPIPSPPSPLPLPTTSSATTTTCSKQLFRSSRLPVALAEFLVLQQNQAAPLPLGFQDKCVERLPCRDSVCSTLEGFGDNFSARQGPQPPPRGEGCARCSS